MDVILQNERFDLVFRDFTLKRVRSGEGLNWLRALAQANAVGLTDHRFTFDEPIGTIKLPDAKKKENVVGAIINGGIVEFLLETGMVVSSGAPVNQLVSVTGKTVSPSRVSQLYPLSEMAYVEYHELLVGRILRASRGREVLLIQDSNIIAPTGSALFPIAMEFDPSKIISIPLLGKPSPETYRGQVSKFKTVGVEEDTLCQVIAVKRDGRIWCYQQGYPIALIDPDAGVVLWCASGYCVTNKQVDAIISGVVSS